MNTETRKEKESEVEDNRGKDTRKQGREKEEEFDDVEKKRKKTRR